MLANRPPIPFKGSDRAENKVLFKILSNNEFVIAFMNYSDKDRNVPVSLRDLGVPCECGKGMELYDVITDEKHSVKRELTKDETALHKKW